MHTPVLQKEVLEFLKPRPGGTYVDATINGGGHARAIRERIGKKGCLLGMDWDCALVEELGRVWRKSGMKNVELVCENYTRIRTTAARMRIRAADGILFDLGFSSYHIERSGRGFSFDRDEPLDMRYNRRDLTRNAADLVNSESRATLEEILRRYGDERHARRITEGIVRARRVRRITSTRELAKIVHDSIPRTARRSGALHPATRTFQALRIAVNRELENLETALPEAAELLASGGRLVVIAFHSLEDRIVKTYFRSASRAGTLTVLTPKPVRPRPPEVIQNPRSRSARLRAAEKR